MTSSPRTPRIVAFIMAVLITATIQGTMLWQFDATAHEGELAQAATPVLATAQSGATRS